MLAFNEDLENPDIRQEPMSLWYWIKHYVRHSLHYPLVLLDVVFCRWFWIQISLYRIQISLYRILAQKEPLYLMDKEIALNEKIKKIESLEESRAKQQKNVSWLETKNQDLQIEIEQLHYELREAKSEMGDLKSTNTSLKREKEDALRRLSEVVSVKLRDNNPNIVDLNDRCRPTKLAEMFSELYDNEWTSAFALLEEKFTEVQAVVILLDTVMEAYYYCEKKLEEPWQILNKWFLNPNLPGLQQTVKWLKDSRKSLVLDKVGEVDEELEELLPSICKVQEVEEILLKSPVQNYTRKCIELCLLMVSTDPPVVLGCPGWIPSKPFTKEERERKKAKTNQQTVDKMRSGTDADKMTQQFEETVLPENHNQALSAEQYTNTAAKTDRDSGIDTKHTQEGKEEKSEAENYGSISNSYDMLLDSGHTTTTTTDPDETLSDDLEENKIEKEKIETPPMTFVNKDDDATIEYTEQQRCDVNLLSGIQPAGGAAQPDGDEEKQESVKANREGEGSQREVDETQRKDEEAKQKVEEEQKGKYREEAGVMEESTVQTDAKSTANMEEDEELVERQQFDKDMFKEYTIRGKYLEFVVWPALYLHKGGPLLGKGVAQGTKEQKRKARQQLWSWRNVDA